MTGLWDDLKKQIKDWGNVAVDKAGEFTKVATDRAEELTRLGKVKLDILQIKRDMEKLFTELGEVLYHHFEKKKIARLSELEEVQKLVDQIKEKEKELAEKNAEIEKIKSVAESESPEKTKEAESTPEEKGEEGSESPEKKEG